MSIRLKAFTGYAEYEIRDDEDKLFAVLHGRTALDAMRLAACWNACQGVSTENLEDNIPIKELAEKYNEALRERDALAARLAELEQQKPVAWYADYEGWGREYNGLPELSNGVIGTPLFARPIPADPVNARLLQAVKNLLSWIDDYAETSDPCFPAVQKQAQDAIAEAEAERDALKRELQESRGIADCMQMLRQDMIDAGVLDASVPPMMMSEAIIPKLKERDALASKLNWMTFAARDVLDERRRQMEVEGWSTEHDDEHLPGELALAAASYVCADEGEAPPAIWPWDWAWWKPESRRRNLVKAAALILAEIERLDRAEAAKINDRPAGGGA